MIENSNELVIQEKKTFYTQWMNTKNIDIEPVHMFMPEKYLTARMGVDGMVQYLNKDDILIIDPTKTKIRECGIYIFEKDGHLLVRQFGVAPFGKDEETRKMVYEVGNKYSKHYYVEEELNVIGAVISKHVEFFHGLYYTSAEREAS